MSEECKWLHEKLEELPLIRYPFELEKLPENGIYFLYERGESWGHDGRKLRIVKTGTHRGDNNFRKRIAEHYLFNEKLMNFDENKLKPSDRCVLRKHIGRALLNKNNDPYLDIWDIDFTTKENRKKYGHLRDIKKEKDLEEEINKIIRGDFYFRFIVVESWHKRKEIERKLVSALAECEKCRPSNNWLGNYSPDEKIRNSGLWQIHYINSPKRLTQRDMEDIENLIQKTKELIR